MSYVFLEVLAEMGLRKVLIGPFRNCYGVAFFDIYRVERDVL